MNCYLEIKGDLPKVRRWWCDNLNPCPSDIKGHFLLHNTAKNTMSASGISCILTDTLTGGLTWHLQYIQLVLWKNLFRKWMILIPTFTVPPTNVAVLYFLPNICYHLDRHIIHFNRNSSYLLRNVVKSPFVSVILIRTGYFSSPLVTLSQSHWI